MARQATSPHAGEVRGGKRRMSAAGGGNVFGADPHRKTLTATVLDCRGGVVATDTFSVSGEGHRAMEAWALSFGPVERWGIEGAGGLGRHTSAFLARRGHDVRDVCPNRTHERRRARQQAKTDASDSVRIARETLADPAVPAAFKRAAGDAGPDETNELISLWHNARRSALASRQHLLNEADSLLADLAEEARAGLPATKDVRDRLSALGGRDRSRAWDAPTALRLQLLDDYAARIEDLDRQDRQITKELAALVKRAGSTLGELCGLDTRSAAELLVEAGDPRRFAGEGAFARFNGTAPLEASSAEGKGEPVRHRLNLGGNRRINAVLHRMAITQLRCDDRAKKIVDDARRRGHTKREARRILKRHLSDVVYRRMMRDIAAGLASGEQFSQVTPAPLT
jgi:transposase